MLHSLHLQLSPSHLPSLSRVSLLSVVFVPLPLQFLRSCVPPLVFGLRLLLLSFLFIPLPLQVLSFVHCVPLLATGIFLSIWPPLTISFQIFLSSSTRCLRFIFQFLPNVFFTTNFYRIEIYRW